ncbi:hypothetical protein PR003_g4367 [Phytophthora rubi]|uniref:Uncharacterized protein n=1 Tax=Phytophthora rubi TaxID=129364 RepID=A0A6A4FMH2_9STRA|nr:hypothetical protein PR003_g4367 [Phytophthora rubi]
MHYFWFYTLHITLSHVTCKQGCLHPDSCFKHYQRAGSHSLHFYATCYSITKCNEHNHLFIG